jgi:hypothetical protein
MARQVPAWFTATSAEVELDGPLAGLAVEVELVALAAELSVVLAGERLVPQPTG